MATSFLCQPVGPYSAARSNASRTTVSNSRANLRVSIRGAREVSARFGGRAPSRWVPRKMGCVLLHSPEANVYVNLTLTKLC
jgi:hypothetical protein